MLLNLPRRCSVSLIHVLSGRYWLSLLFTEIGDSPFDWKSKLSQFIQIENYEAVKCLLKLGTVLLQSPFILFLAYFRLVNIDLRPFVFNVASLTMLERIPVYILCSRLYNVIYLTTQIHDWKCTLLCCIHVTTHV